MEDMWDVWGTLVLNVWCDTLGSSLYAGDSAGAEIDYSENNSEQ